VLSEGEAAASVTVLSAGVGPIDEPDDADDESELTGADLLGAGEDSDDEAARAKRSGNDETDDEHDENVQSAEVIPLRATEDEQ
jgi:hypothetical protein